MITRRKLLMAAPALILPRSAKAWTHGAVPANNGLIINLVPTAAFLAAPSAFQSAVQTAANLHMAQWVNTPITVNIQVGYDEFGASGGTSFENPTFGQTVSYGTVRSKVQAIATASGNATMVSAFGALPNTVSLGGIQFFSLNRSALKLYGISPDFASNPVTARDNVIDSQIGFGSATPLGNLVGTALYEINHAMGRDTNYAFYLTHFTAAATWQVGAHTLGSYFSVDGGTNNLCYYDNLFDFTGFANNDAGSAPGAPTLPNDAFCWKYNGSTTQSLSAIDIQALNCVGYW